MEIGNKNERVFIDYFQNRIIINEFNIRYYLFDSVKERVEIYNKEFIICVFFQREIYKKRLQLNKIQIRIEILRWKKRKRGVELEDRKERMLNKEENESFLKDLLNGGGKGGNLGFW